MSRCIFITLCLIFSPLARADFEAENSPEYHSLAVDKLFERVRGLESNYPTEDRGWNLYWVAITMQRSPNRQEPKHRQLGLWDPAVAWNTFASPADMLDYSKGQATRRPMPNTSRRAEILEGFSASGTIDHNDLEGLKPEHNNRPARTEERVKSRPRQNYVYFNAQEETVDTQQGSSEGGLIISGDVYLHSPIRHRYTVVDGDLTVDGSNDDGSRKYLIVNGTVRFLKPVKNLVVIAKEGVAAVELNSSTIISQGAVSIDTASWVGIHTSHNIAIGTEGEEVRRFPLLQQLRLETNTIIELPNAYKTLHTLSFGPESERMAFIEGNEIQLWRYEDGKFEFAQRYSYRGIQYDRPGETRFSPDGKLLAVSGTTGAPYSDVYHGFVDLIDLTTGKVIAELLVVEYSEPCPEYDDCFRAGPTFSFSASGDKIVAAPVVRKFDTGQQDLNGLTGLPDVKVWDTESFQLIERFRWSGQNVGLGFVDFSTDGEKLVLLDTPDYTTMRSAANETNDWAIYSLEDGVFEDRGPANRDVFSPQALGFDVRNRPDYESLRQEYRVELQAANFPFSEQLEDRRHRIALRYAEIQFAEDDRFFAWTWPGPGKIWVMEKKH